MCTVVLTLSPVQVCGRVYLPVSSWLVLWLPCSGSSTTLSRSTSACPAPLPLRCQSPWRRSLASQSKSPPSISVLSPPPKQHPHRTQPFSIFMLSARAALQSCFYSCIFKNITNEQGEDVELSLWSTKSLTQIFLCKNVRLVLSLPVIRESGNSNKEWNSSNHVSRFSFLFIKL